VAHPSKRKGDGFELEVVHFLQDAGIAAEKIPLSGAVKGGSFEGDIAVPIRGVDKRLECKRRARAFGTLYGWLANHYALVVRDNRTEPLVLLRLKDFVDLAR
jgi:Holliday junction resolvase